MKEIKEKIIKKMKHIKEMKVIDMSIKKNDEKETKSINSKNRVYKYVGEAIYFQPPEANNESNTPVPLSQQSIE